MSRLPIALLVTPYTLSVENLIRSVFFLSLLTMASGCSQQVSAPADPMHAHVEQENVKIKSISTLYLDSIFTDSDQRKRITFDGIHRGGPIMVSYLIHDDNLRNQNMLLIHLDQGLNIDAEHTQPSIALVKKYFGNPTSTKLYFSRQAIIDKAESLGFEKGIKPWHTSLVVYGGDFADIKWILQNTLSESKDGPIIKAHGKTLIMHVENGEIQEGEWEKIS